MVLLSPYRQKTETGANALNHRLQGKINPPGDGKMDAVLGQRRFRTGDKVMQIKNCEDINNGDVGYITSITGTLSESVVRIDFGDGRVVDYENGDLDMLEHGNIFIERENEQGRGGPLGSPLFSIFYTYEIICFLIVEIFTHFFYNKDKLLSILEFDWRRYYGLSS